MCGIAWMDTRNRACRISLCGMFSSAARVNGGATWSAESQLSGPVRGYDYILPEGFRFPFGDYFSIAIDNLGTTHVVWGEGRNFKSSGIDLVCERDGKPYSCHSSPAEGGARNRLLPPISALRAVNFRRNKSECDLAWGVVGSSSSVYLGYTPHPLFF